MPWGLEGLSEVAEDGKARGSNWPLSGVPGLPSCLTASNLPGRQRQMEQRSELGSE